MTLVKDTEPSHRFHLWTAVTIVAAMLGRKCEIEFGPETVHPNLYTVLTGPPGSRKSVAIKYGSAILSKAMASKPGLASLSSVITRQAFFQQLAAAEQTDPDPANNSVFTHCSLFVIASELVTFFQGKDVNERMADLCDLYDGKNIFDYKTKTSGNIYAVRPSVWILGATTPNWIQVSMPQLAVGGGMTSRTIFVVSMNKGQHIPYTRMKPFDADLTNGLILDLNEIRKMIGKFRFDDEATKFYEFWYDGPYKEHGVKDPRLLTYIERLPSMIVKVAMVKSAARSDSMTITKEDLQGSICLFSDLHKTMPLAFGGHGMSKLSAQTNMVKELLRNRIYISEAEIMSTLDMHISKLDLVQIKDTLVSSRFCHIDLKDGERYWFLSDEQLKQGGEVCG